MPEQSREFPKTALSPDSVYLISIQWNCLSLLQNFLHLFLKGLDFGRCNISQRLVGLGWLLIVGVTWQGIYGSSGMTQQRTNLKQSINPVSIPECPAVPKTIVASARRECKMEFVLSNKNHLPTRKHVSHMLRGVFRVINNYSRAA